MKRAAWWVGVTVIVGLACVARPVQAQGTGRSLDIDLSIRSAGAGGASNAVFWGGDPNHWANPALLGYQRGMVRTWGKTQLVPDLADDVILESTRYTFGYAGITLAFGGRGPGSILLDYGPNEGRDESGTPTGAFAAYERIESWGFGLSLAELIAMTATMSGGEPPWITRHADVAFGYMNKDIRMQLAQAATSASGTGIDVGVLARISPLVYDSGVAPGGLPLRVDVAYGWSVINTNDERIVFINEDQASPLTRGQRNGLAARIALGLPPESRERRRVGWFMEGLDPLLSVGLSKDWEHNSAGGMGSFYDVDRSGVEVAIANVFTWRIGHVSDQTGDIDGMTSGWGLGMRLGRFAGFRYDHAEVPQARGLDDVSRKGYTVFVDPLALLHRGAATEAPVW